MRASRPGTLAASGEGNRGASSWSTGSHCTVALTIPAVCRAIINSSFVGITQAETLLAGVDIRGPRLEFAASSSSIPSQAEALQMRFRISADGFRRFSLSSAKIAMDVGPTHAAAPGTQGHPAYRVVAQEMHRLIAEKAGHHAVAEMMRFVDNTPEPSLERLEAERRAEARRSSR